MIGDPRRWSTGSKSSVRRRLVRHQVEGVRDARRAAGWELPSPCRDGRYARPVTTRVSLMLAVEDAQAAAAWYAGALGAAELWSLGSVVGLEIEGAPFFLHEPTGTGFESPVALGAATARVEVFVDDPDAFVSRAVAAGADGSRDAVRDHRVPWGVHRQRGFRDPFGHVWLVGDTSPLEPFPPRAGRAEVGGGRP